MAWQDVRGWYVERDDEPDPPPPVLAPCQVCGTPHDAEDETCGSRECGDRLDDWRRAGLDPDE
jgi:hypothetical protein